MTPWLRYIGAALLGASVASTAPAQVPWPRPVPIAPPRVLAQQDSKAQMLTDWYRHFLRREPDPTGMNGWMAQLDLRDPDRTLAKVLGSPEYAALAGGRDDLFIRQMVVDVTGSEPLPKDLRYWLRRLEHDGSHERVALELLRYAHGGGLRF